MDLSLMAAMSSALNAARDIGKAAVNLRDFNQMSAVISQLNDQILKAQDSLFGHQAQLLALQEELFQTKEEIRLLKQKESERENYGLFEVSNGVFVYRLKDRPGTGEIPAQPVHYLCQPCFDSGAKIVLIRHECAISVSHHCPKCNSKFLEREKPMPEHPRSTGGHWMS